MDNIKKEGIAPKKETAPKKEIKPTNKKIKVKVKSGVEYEVSDAKAKLLVEKHGGKII